MKLSIITPSFNGHRFLPAAARSILDQQGDFQLEWIVIDGGSTDGTIEFLQGLKDPRLQWISEPDRGQSDALNKGLSRATGDIVAWLNTDDTYADGALDAVSQEFRSSRSAQWLVGRYEVIDATDRVIRSSVVRYKERSLRRYSYRALLRENFISQPAVFWRREFGQQAGPLDGVLNWTMDYDLWLRMGRIAPPLYLDRVLAHFRLHPASKTGKVDRRQFDEQYAVACRYFDSDRLSRIVHRLNVEKIVWAYRVMRLLGM